MNDKTKLESLYSDLRKSGFEKDLTFQYKEDNILVTCKCMTSGIGDLYKLRRHTNQVGHKEKCGWYLDENLNVCCLHKGNIF